MLDEERLCLPGHRDENEIRDAQVFNARGEIVSFAGHNEGATIWGRLASLIQTVKLNGIEPYAWFKASLEAIPAGHPNDRIDDLMYWAFKPPSS